MLQKLWLADLPPPSRQGRLSDAHRHRVPVLVGHPRRRPGARPRPGRTAHRARPPRLGARARRRGRARPRAVRRDGRQGRPDPVQRVGRAGAVRRRQCGARAALAARRRVRRGARARAGAAEPVVADVHDPRRADGRHVPRGDGPLTVPGDVRHRPAAVPREARRPDRGLLGRAQGDRRAPRRGRRRHPQRCRGLALRRGPTAAGLPAPGRDRRVRRALRRAAQGHGRPRRRDGTPGRRTAATCRCWSPDAATRASSPRGCPPT